VSSVKTPSSQPQPQQPQPIVNWSNSYNDVKYKDNLISKLQELGPLNISAARSTQIQIDGYICSIAEAMVEAAKLAGCIPKKQYSPKKYWCPELSRLRDSKRFWWHLWVSNGRPRIGEVFKCWKGVKKMFRQLCRKRVDQVNTDYFHAPNEALQHNNTPRFWKPVKQGRRSSRHCNHTIDVKSLSDLYRSVMTDSGSCEFTDDQLRIKDTVSQVEI